MTAQANPEEFIVVLKQHGITEAYFILQDNKLIASHPALNGLAQSIQTWPDFLNHEGIFIELDEQHDALLAAFVYNTVRGQAAGGVRFKSYDTTAAFFQDGLRLAKGMADKNAVSRLWWGGGKGVIYFKNAEKATSEERKAIYERYGQFMSKLNGVYVTAEDLNTRPADMASIFSQTRHTTCIPEKFGGSSNPSIFTAKGVFNGLKAAADYNYGFVDSLKGKIVLLQGAGNVGYHVMELLIESGAKVLVFETNSTSKEKIKNKFNANQAEIIEDEMKFYESEADIFSPNAIGAILNDETIPLLKVDIIAGGANNQLKDSVEHSLQLHEKGILYLPDFFINRLGIINCANEQYGYVKADIEKEVELVYSDSTDLIKKSVEQNCSPQKIANQIALDRMKIPHPIWGHRGPALVKELIKNGFAQSKKTAIV